MKVKDILDRMMMCSTIDLVTLCSRGFIVKRLNKEAVRNRDYFGFGNDSVLTFEIMNDRLVLNIKSKL